jgi:drug/metabolite transporter (DMT)-like permease
MPSAMTRKVPIDDLGRLPNSSAILRSSSMFAFFSRHRYSLSLVGAAACWGVATVVSKRALDEIPPLTLLPVQLAVSVVVLGAVVRAQGLRVNWSTDMRRLAAWPGGCWVIG